MVTRMKFLEIALAGLAGIACALSTVVTSPKRFLTLISSTSADISICKF